MNTGRTWLAVATLLVALAMFFLTNVLTGCAKETSPFTTEEETFTVAVQVEPSSSVRTETTALFWNSEAITEFDTSFVLDGEASHVHAASESPAIGRSHSLVDEDGHEEHPEELEAEVEPSTHLGTFQTGGYDVEVAVMHPQHRMVWHDDMGEWHDTDPAAGDERYLLVRVGSSSGTGRHPHVHGSWSNIAPYVDDLNDDEKELAEEEFFGMRQLFTGSTVSLTVDGRPYGGNLEVDGQDLRGVETREGAGYADNFVLPDGTYDVTVTVAIPRLARLSDAELTWMQDTTFVFTSVAISGADGSEGASLRGRNNRSVDAGTSADFVVIDGWDETGHGHPHQLYLRNHKGDVSQDLTTGANNLVCKLRARSAQDLSDAGVYVSPQVPVAAAAIYLEVVLYDPRGLLHHDEENFFDLSNSSVEVTITNDASGEQVELHTDELVPTYSHSLGFHYGANFSLPAGGGGQPEEEEPGGGHTHE